MFVVSVIGVFQQLHSPDLPVSENFPFYQTVQKLCRSSRSPVFKPGENTWQGIICVQGPIPGCAASLLGSLQQIASPFQAVISHQ